VKTEWMAKVASTGDDGGYPVSSNFGGTENQASRFCTDLVDFKGRRNYFLAHFAQPKMILPEAFLHDRLDFTLLL